MISNHTIKQDYSQAIAEWVNNGGVVKQAINQYQYKLNVKEERLHGKRKEKSKTL